MAGRIPQSFINELLSRVDLVEVIDHRVPLKKSGRNYSACCPFHNEKTPSFSVNSDKQFYYCFGCGASGNAISFLMEYEGLEFVAAIEDLAAQMSMEVPREAHDNSEPQKPDLFPLMEKVANHYQQQLKTPQAAEAVAYLKNRGLSGEVAKQFNIGYAPDAWQNLMTLGGDSKKLQADLLEAGMMIEKENGHAYDRFRGRIMFPIRNRRGQVLGFGGRVLGKGEPKYLNSPETPLFHKGNEVYGLYEMRKQLRQIEQIIIVEGYMDVVALAQFGIHNSVATLGTATTPEHLQQLFRICSSLVFCFDGDKAGRAAALRAVNVALPLLKEDREVRLVFLPDGEDPDSLVRRIGTQEFTHTIKSGVTLLDYLIEHLCAQVDLNTIEGAAKLVHLASAFLQLLQYKILRMAFVQKLSQITNLPPQQIWPADFASKKDVQAPNKTQFTQAENQPVLTRKPVLPQLPQTNKTQTSRTAQRAIALLLQHPQSFSTNLTLDWLATATGFEAIIIKQLIDALKQDSKLTTAMLIEMWRNTEHEELIKFLVRLPLHQTCDNAKSELQDIFTQFQKQHLKNELDSLVEKQKHQPLSVEEKNRLKSLFLMI